MSKDYAKILTSCKSRLDSIKQKSMMVDAEIESLNKRLKKEFGVNSLSEAKKLSIKLNGEIQELTTEIDEELYEIREILDGLEE